MFWTDGAGLKDEIRKCTNHLNECTEAINGMTKSIDRMAAMIEGYFEGGAPPPLGSS